MSTAKVIRLPTPGASPDDSPELAAAREIRARWGRLGSVLVARYVLLLVAGDLAEPASRHERRALERLRMGFRACTRAMRLMLKVGA